MESSANLFKNAIDKAYTTQPNVKLNTDTIGDALKYKKGFTEEVEDDEDNDFEYETFLDKRLKKSAKDQFKKDLQQDKDFAEFKKNTKFDKYYTFGTPNVSDEDPFIKKNKYSRIGKQEFEEGNEKLKGGRADNKTFKDLVSKNLTKGTEYGKIESRLKTQLNKGIKVEMEHTSDKRKAKEIALDHLFEDPKYYDKLKKIEGKEATGSGSVGAYSAPVFGGDNQFWERSRSETPNLKESDVEKVEATEATGSGSVGGYESPAMWAKSTSKKDWGPSRKTQYKGGSFVKVKKKCTKFPYCNQGDINALKISKNESIKEAIDNVAKKLGVNKTIIMNILEHEYKKLNKRIK
jgi:hypothetical protein